MGKFILNFIRNESGVTAIEYGLIASLISIGIVAAVTSIGSDLKTTFNTAATNLK